jgi:hypothetical protein
MGIGCIGSSSPCPCGAGAGNGKNPLADRHCVGPAVLLLELASSKRARLIDAREGSGCTASITSLDAVVRAAVPASYAT